MQAFGVLQKAGTSGSGSSVCAEGVDSSGMFMLFSYTYVSIMNVEYSGRSGYGLFQKCIELWTTEIERCSFCIDIITIKRRAGRQE